MQMSGNVAQGKSKFARQNPKDQPQQLTPPASPRSDAEGAARADHSESNGAPSSCPGFLLLDTAFRPLYANQEALAALAFPADPAKNNGLGDFVENRVRSLFALSSGSRPLTCRDSFASGRRCYQLRMFSVRSPVVADLKPGFAILLERNHKPGIDLSVLLARFRMTPREVETVDHLVHGFNTRQIADRMCISPNTVKAFLRSIMMKMGTDNRAGIIAKILHSASSTSREASSKP